MSSVLGALGGAAGGGAPSVDATPVAWFLLSIAKESEEVRADPVVRQLADALLARGLPAAKQLDTVLRGAAPAAGGPRLGVEDLRQAAGGRHDNDYSDYRSIDIMVTSEEVGPEGNPHCLDGVEIVGPTGVRLLCPSFISLLFLDTPLISWAGASDPGNHWPSPAPYTLPCVKDEARGGQTIDDVAC